MKKRLLSAFLSLCMMLTMLPAVAFAAPDEKQSQDLVSLNYDGGLIDQNITVNVYVDHDIKQTLSVNDAAAADNQISIRVNDGINYEIDSVDVVGGSATSEKIDASFKEYTCTWNGYNDVTFNVYLREPLGKPETPNGIYEGNATVEFRAYDPHVLKLLYTNLEDPAAVDVDTEIEKVTLNFVEKFGYGESEDLLPADREEDYLYYSFSNATSLAVPSNIESLTIESSAGTVTIPAGELRLVLKYEGVAPYYSIESTDDEAHIVYFYNETTANNYSPYAIRFVEDGQCIGEENMPQKPTYPTTNYEFVAWTETYDGGKPFISTTIVEDDITVYSQRKAKSSNPSEIHVMNNGDLLKERILELYDLAEGDINWDSVKIAVYGVDDEHTNPDYALAPNANGWRSTDNVEYYFVYNYLTGVGDQQNDSIFTNDISKIEITASKNDGTELGAVTINKGIYDGDFAVSTGIQGSGYIVQLYINDNNTPNPNPEPEPDPTPDGDYDITGITKTLVESAGEAPEGITGTYTYPDSTGKVTIPEGESVTLLYSITVTGKANATFTVTDEGATLVSSNGNTVTQGIGDDADTFSGTIPTGGSITFYVSKTFDASDIEDGELTNTATVAGTGENDVDPENDEDVEETPAEEDDGGGEEPGPSNLNGTAVTVQVYVDDQAVTDPLTYVELSRRTGNDSYTGWSESDPDSNGIITCDFDYYGEKGYDCVDINVKLKDANTYLLQGIRSYQSYGEKGTNNVIDNSTDGTYVIDNVCAGQGDIDAYIYLYTKYAVEYYQGDQKLTDDNYTDETIYITGESVKASTSTDKYPQTGGFSIMQWKNDTAKTSITVKDLPTEEGKTITGWWMNDSSCSGEANYAADSTVQVSQAVSGITDHVIKFYAKVTDNVPGEKTYTLTYDANGGDTTSVPEPVTNIPAEYELALDTTPIPTHEQATPAGGTDAVDVLFIGWMEEDNDTIIYSRNDTAPDTITKVTFASADITVYAAWGYDEDGNGIADVLEKDSIVITPADITIYTGGAGYSGVVDGDAETVNNSGFPEPGYYITLPDELDAQLKAATGHTGDDPVDLSEYLTFSYDDNVGTTREWKLERYDNSGDSQAYGKYIYRLVPTGDAPDVRLSITDEAGATMTSDNFVESIDNLYEVYSMGIYAGDLNQDLITATVTIPDEADNTNENILVGTGTLTVRGTTAETAQADLDGGTANGITVQAADGTTYSINESELQVAEENDVQLLVDELVYDETSINALKTEAHEDISAIDAANHTFDFKYMDLVDSSNGNAWITTDQDLTITWAYPTGESKTGDTNFAVVHYPGLDRDYDDAAAAIGNVTAVALEIERTEDGLRFTAGADGFSPFALVSGSGTGENPLTTYQITYNANGGSGDDRIFEYAVNTATVKESLFTRAGYTFTGWSTEPGGNGTNYAAGDTITLTGDITLYAQWKSNGGSSSGGTTRYTLTYESNGGTEYDSERYTRNTVVDLDKVPSREGYTFTGWYADAELTEQISEIKMTSNKTVYAGWEVTGVPDWLNGDDHFAYVIGYSDGTVKPLNNISRAEVATIFFRLLKPEIRDEYLTQTSQFTDVSADAWYNTAVSTMAALGIVNGRTADTFAPDASITRAEFAAICARFDTNKRDGDSNFSDIAGHWAEAEIERAATLGWINGYSDGTFHPDNAITRAEAMTMINRVLQRLPETENDLLDDMNVWPDNQPSAWYYLAVQEATNSHDFDRKDDGVHETWTDMTADPDWMQYQ